MAKKDKAVQSGPAKGLQHMMLTFENTKGEKAKDDGSLWMVQLRATFDGPVFSEPLRDRFLSRLIARVKANRHAILLIEGLRGRC